MTNTEKGIPINKVRIKAVKIKNPINIRLQRDMSRHEYKRQYHVDNDRNYLMVIYIGKDKKGKENRDCEVVSNLEAAKFFKRSNDRSTVDNQMVPIYSPNGYELAYTLKIGTMVLLYENTPEEVWEQDQAGLQKRLYKVTGISTLTINKYKYGTLVLTHHQEARPATDIKEKNGKYISGEEIRPRIRMLHTQINALVEGVDFRINDIGEITRLI